MSTEQPPQSQGAHPRFRRYRTPLGFDIAEAEASRVVIEVAAAVHAAAWKAALDHSDRLISSEEAGPSAQHFAEEAGPEKARLAALALAAHFLTQAGQLLTLEVTTALNTALAAMLADQVYDPKDAAAVRAHEIAAQGLRTEVPGIDEAMITGALARWRANADEIDRRMRPELIVP